MPPSHHAFDLSNLRARRGLGSWQICPFHCEYILKGLRVRKCKTICRHTAAHEGVELPSLHLPFSCRRLSQGVNWATPCHDIRDTPGYWPVLARYRIHNFLILFHFRGETRSLSIGIALAHLAF